MQTRISGFRLAGVATALPAGEVTMDSLGPRFGEDYITRITASTGVLSVRVAAPGVKASDLAFAAAQHLIKEMAIDIQSIDALIFVTQTPDHVAPPTAPSLQTRLGLSTDTIAYDLGFGCSGYVYGLYQSALHLKAGGCRNVLLLAGDVLTRYVNKDDKALSMVIGDGATASLLTRSDDKDEAGFVLGSDGSGVGSLCVPAGGSVLPRSPETAVGVVQKDGNMRSLDDMQMDGSEIMLFALKTVPPLVRNLLEVMEWQKEDVPQYVFHQANKLIVESIGKKLKLDPAQYPILLAHTGNTSPASIPVALSVMKGLGTDFTKLTRAVLCGFGIGLSFGAVGIDLSRCEVFAPIDVD